MQKTIELPWFVSLKSRDKRFPELFRGFLYISPLRGWDTITGEPVFFVMEKQRWYPAEIFVIKREIQPN